jgi:hypothetical protein
MGYVNVYAIFKNENVYTFVEKLDTRSDVSDFIESENYIVGDDKQMVNLFGGRIILKYVNSSCYKMKIDDIEIVTIKYSASGNGFYIENGHSPSQIVAYLNQIENLGIDSFLDNYKMQLQNWKKEMENLVDKIEQELSIKYDDSQNKKLNRFRDFIMELSCILLALLINMNAGLDNYNYVNAYDTIINLFF